LKATLTTGGFFARLKNNKRGTSSMLSFILGLVLGLLASKIISTLKSLFASAEVKVVAEAAVVKSDIEAKI